MRLDIIIIIIICSILQDNMRFFLQQSLISEAIVASGSEDVSLYS